MLQRTLNLGILAHVDAGKTTLTERLLFAAGVIDDVGSVDAGTTQTDSLALERQRGITIRSAVASFALGDVNVNLIDTPGHPDFIAEVERVLSVLDGAVLVISAVEGVQPQTRILMRALQRLHIPTLIFINKIDRPGAGDEHVLKAISERLGAAIVPMGTARELGTRTASFAQFSADDPEFSARLAEVLADRDEEILTAYVEDASHIPYRQLREELTAQTHRALVHPVFFGSAITGAGTQALMTGLAELLPAPAGDPDGPVSGVAFKIERGANREKIAYVRMFSGTIRTRDRLQFGRELEDKVTAIAVFERGPAVARPLVAAGDVGKLWGLAEIQIGDRIGETGSRGAHDQFPPPTLESVVVARDSGDRERLRTALAQLAEQDPLINVRQDDSRQEISVSLYGEVQKEVVQATLAAEFGLDVTFSATTPIYIERPVGPGEAIEILGAESNPFLAAIELRVEPAPNDTGIAFRVQVDPRTVPLYLYKTVEGFTERMDQYVRQTLSEGIFGWQVTDCVVTMTKCTYSVPDGPPSRRGPLSRAADFRKLTPLVLMRALERAKPVVCEPIVRVDLEIPTGTIGAVLAALARLGATVETPSPRRNLSTIETILPAARAQDLQRQLAGLTGGEGVLDSTFAGYQPVSGDQPTRPRTTPNPLNLAEYMRQFALGVGST
ncbi:MAG TPA: translation factor GTPase family protein [Gaiellaceae bacterium]|nr:translation factor GTPase family protein [Gaiellaceae bacterium]